LGRPRRPHLFAALGAVVGAVAAVTAGLPGPAGPLLRPDSSTLPVISTVANPHPQLISGSRTLVRVEAPSGSGDRPRITLNGRTVSGAFRPGPDGGWLGLVTGLRPGINTLAAWAGGRTALLRITDHPISGPVFSGPQQHPYFCETPAFGLAPSAQPDCSAPTTVGYRYRTAAGTFKVLADPRSRPADLAEASVDGRPVPYVVRLETGTVDRAVYQTAVLYGGGDPSPFRRDAGWNGKLVYTFGGGCNGGYHQGDTTGGVLDDQLLSQGFAVASSTLNVLDQNCDIPLSAEAAMMVKEHFVDVYGPVRHTIGWGGSGGAIQQYDIADAYPGILDGIVPSISFTDPLSVATTVADCRLLDAFYARAGEGSSFGAAQRRAVSGFTDEDSCRSWDAFFADRLTPTGSCNRQLIAPDSAIPASAQWNAVTAPGGLKCSLTQQLANQLGTDPATGFANSPLDNTGVQYGLEALNRGLITVRQFLALNRDIGGLDPLGRPTPRRSVASAAALDAAYRDDLVTSGSLGLADTPVIDQREDLDRSGVLNDIHTTQWSFAMRARLRQADGGSADQVVIENRPVPDQAAAAGAYALHAMDQWLAAVEADGSHRTRAQKVTADRPSGLADGCYLDASHRVAAPVTDPATGPCAALYPVGATPRQVAGGPLAADTLKCRLRPVDFSGYRVTFSAGQRAELRSVFPSGVCDFRLPGIGRQPPLGAWLSYGDGAGATFGHAPAPVPLDRQTVRPSVQG